eukprot:997257-Alexandrium_andersonii.AAC.1
MSHLDLEIETVWHYGTLKGSGKTGKNGAELRSQRYTMRSNGRGDLLTSLNHAPLPALNNG